MLLTDWEARNIYYAIDALLKEEISIKASYRLSRIAEQFSPVVTKSQELFNKILQESKEKGEEITIDEANQKVFEVLKDESAEYDFKTIDIDLLPDIPLPLINRVFLEKIITPIE